MTTSTELAPRAFHYTMTLFVTGATRLSLAAIANVRAFCEEELTDCYELEVVDLYRTPERAKSAQVIAAPTLLRIKPKPCRRVVGDMSNRDKLRAAVKAG